MTGNTIMYNNRLLPASKANIILPSLEGSVYEVLRVVDRVPLFLEDHLERLRHSLSMKKYNPFADDERLSQQLHKLIDANEIENGNVRMDIWFEGHSYHQAMYQVEASYPGISDYRDGVKLITVWAEREHPDIKQTQISLRNQINIRIKEADAYEALLINKQGEITEGSRSNVFFIKGKQMFTAPDYMVLEGITASYVKSICNEHNLNMKYHAVNCKDLSAFESAFITGTSPKVLPIKAINSQAFNVNNHLLNLIMDAYNKIIHQYVDKRKQNHGHR